MSTPRQTTATHTTTRRPASRGNRARWGVTAIILAAIGFAAGGLNSVLADASWWFVMVGVAAIVLTASSVARAIGRGQLSATVAGIAAAVGALTLLFAPGASILGVIPTFDTFDAFAQLIANGNLSISTQAIPADVDAGIMFLLAAGVAVVALCMDAVVFGTRIAALAGIPLLVLLLVPSFVRPELNDPLFFALTAAAYLALLIIGTATRAGTRASSRTAAVGVAASAIAASLVIPLMLPALDGSSPASGTTGLSTGINPIISLGNDLRQGATLPALTYTTTEPGGLYFRLTALDNFNGRAWEPTDTKVIVGNNVDAIGAPPGLTPLVPVTAVTTDVSVANILSRWLPVPYAPSRISGLDGAWSWEPDGLSIRSERSSARGQKYEVQSIQVAPSIDQLVDAGTRVDAALGQYLEVPNDLPPIVAETALEVVGDAETNYDRALALQEYFRGGGFQYSEEAPVEAGYDGSGAGVLAEFLAVKSGYCVHFSSAMAAMARTLDIPARVAVGFTPGQPVTDDGGRRIKYSVTTDNLHAWPELYFADIGWVRFEPTPGRGFVPQFAPLAVDDPATPEVDESVPSPAATVGPTAAPNLPAEEVAPDAAAPGAGASTPVQPALFATVALIALLLTPALVRAARRARRFAMVDRGSASSAWDELRDTADDLGFATGSARTPRQLSATLATHIYDAEPLVRLQIAIEAEAFADRDGAPDAGDLRAVTGSLAKATPLGRRLGAIFLPRSLFARWRSDTYEISGAG